MLAGDLQDEIVASLVRDKGGTRRRWRVALGTIRIFDLRTHPHCNWSFTLSGAPNENAAIEQLLDDLRLRVPHVLP